VIFKKRCAKPSSRLQKALSPAPTFQMKLLQFPSEKKKKKKATSGGALVITQPSLRLTGGGNSLGILEGEKDNKINSLRGASALLERTKSG
jgi:hypothetical protein